MNCAAARDAVLSSLTTDVMQMLSAESCPDAIVRRICARVGELGNGMRAEFEGHADAAPRHSQQPGASTAIPIRIRDDDIVGTLHVSVECDCDPADLECAIVRHVVQMIQLVLTRKQDRADLRKERTRAYVALQRTADAVITTDEAGKVDYVNPIAEQLLACELRSVVGTPIEDLVSLTDEAGSPLKNPLREALRIGKIIPVGMSAALEAGNGQRVFVRGSAAPLTDPDGKNIGAVLVLHDLSDLARVAQQLAYQASHDPLTGLLNRYEFGNLLVAHIDAKDPDGPRGALLQIDIDQLKVVNDTFGHVVGDELLREASDLIRRCASPTDTVARLSGDEFGILVRDRDLATVLAQAEAIRGAIERFRFSWRGAIADVRCSIGVAPIDGAPGDATAILGAADVACYAAKKAGRNRVHVYSDADSTPQHEEMRWVSRIAAAMEEERFELFYQPLAPLQDSSRGGGRHYEILVRMRDEAGALVPPSRFIPAAETYNLMPRLDRWIIKTACEQHAYRGAGRAPYTLALNVSGKSLSDDRFLAYVIRELRRNKLPRGAICFEITETAAISDLSRVVRFIKLLRELGCYFALDDFGSGLSSFAYLKRLPVDFLKIDGHFVRDMLKDRIDVCMVRAISQVARSVGIATVAEHVETAEVLDAVTKLGVDYAQGYHIAQPVPMAQFDAERLAV